MATSTLPEIGNTTTVQGFLLNGKPQPTENRAVLEVIFPADGQTLVGRCALLSESDIPQVLSAAQSGFDRWKTTHATRRAEVLEKIATLLEARFDEAARLITLETGKPLKLAQVETTRAIGVFKGYAEYCKWQRGETFFIEGRDCRVRHFPLGPVIAVAPYNFPLNLVAHKLAPAIAAGNSITIKPASKTPLIALLLGEIAAEAGYHAISVIPSKASLAEKLVQSDVFKKLSFTGSSDIGWHLKAQAGKKVVTLELGGNAACIIESLTEPVETVAKRVAQGAFWLSGQSCISVQRVFVQEKLYPKFLKAFVVAAQAMTVGDPLSLETEIGAMISPDDVTRSLQMVQDAVAQGATLETGGTAPTSSAMVPTVLAHTRPTMSVNCQECFAPIATVIPYRTFEEALTQVNDSDFGLQAGVYTTSQNQAEQAYQTLEVGGVIINDIPTFRLDALPYGGIKDSGLGREGILTGVAEMSYLKTCIAKPLG